MKKTERFILVSAILLLLASVAALLPIEALSIDLVSHFPLQYLGISVLGILACISLKFVGCKLAKTSYLFICSTLINSWVLAPYFPSSSLPSSTGRSFKVAVANVFIKSHNHAAVISFIQKEKPDLAILIEINERWVQKMAPLKKIYPYTFDIPRPDNFGMMLLSKKPIELIETKLFTKNKSIISLIFDLTIFGNKHKIISVHTAAPITPQKYKLRKSHLHGLADWVSAQGKPSLILGDLNTTPFSYAFKQFLTKSKLKDTRMTRGVFPTWGFFNLWLLRIPIDHILISANLEIQSLKIGPNIGSDHTPIIAVIRPRNSSSSTE